MSVLEFLVAGIIGVASSFLIVQLQEKAERWDALRHKED